MDVSDLDDFDFGETRRGNSVGDRVFDRFILKKILGRGGMGIVWLVQDDLLNREAVLKFVPEIVRFDPTAVDELKSETRKGLDLSHPNIVRVFDFLLDETNAAISMEYVNGDTLGKKRTQIPNKVFTAEQLTPWVTELLDGLHYAHTKAKLVHRDLKPANLMVDQDSVLKITDFGIARSIADSLSRATIEGSSSGSIAYMSPQQALGKAPDISDDIYSFGSTLYELLTGRPPFHTGDIAAQVQEVEPTDLETRRQELGIQAAPIPSTWSKVILSCLEKHPPNRPSDAMEVLSAMGLGRTTAPPPTNSAPEVSKSAPSAQIDSPSTPLLSSKPEARKQEAAVPKIKKGKGKLLFLIIAFSTLLACAYAGVWYFFLQEKTPDETQIVSRQETLQGEIRALLTQPEKSDLANEKLAAYFNEFGEDPFYRENRSTSEKPEEKPPVVITNNDPIAIVVPDTHKTLTEAVAAAKDGETITIKEGTYQNVGPVVLRPGLRLQGSDPSKTVILGDPEFMGPVLQVKGEGEVWVENVTIKFDSTDYWPPLETAAGLLSEGTQLNITNSVIQGIRGDGVILSGYTKSPSNISELTVTNCSENGVLVERGATFTAENLSCKKNGQCGIYVVNNGSCGDIQNSEFSNNGENGALFGLGASGQVQGSKFLSNKQAGMLFMTEAEGIKLHDNEMSDNTESGLAVQEGARVNLSQCTISKNRRHGVSISEPSFPNILKGNSIIGNSRIGILMSSKSQGETLISKNTIKGNHHLGIGITGDGANPDIFQNQILENGNDGILLDEGSAATVVDNTVTQNDGNGISLLGTGKGTSVQKNVITENGGTPIEVSNPQAPPAVDGNQTN